MTSDARSTVVNSRLSHFLRRTALGALVPAVFSGCAQSTNSRNDLNAMKTALITIRDQSFQVWLAQSTEEVTRGLMQVSQDELAPTSDGAERGMLFVFDRELPRAFWMFNTPTPLDIAYARADGTIVKIWTMKPLDTSTYPSIQPAQFALEVKAGCFAKLGIFEGDRIVLPDDI